MINFTPVYFTSYFRWLRESEGKRVNASASYFTNSLLIQLFTLRKEWWVNKTRLSTCWVMRQDFHAYKQKSTNHIARNCKLLTAHISKSTFSYTKRRYIFTNPVLYYPVRIPKMFFSAVCIWRQIMSVYPSFRAECKGVRN